MRLSLTAYITREFPDGFAPAHAEELFRWRSHPALWRWMLCCQDTKQPSFGGLVVLTEDDLDSLDYAIESGALYPRCSLVTPFRRRRDRAFLAEACDALDFGLTVFVVLWP